MRPSPSAATPVISVGVGVGVGVVAGVISRQEGAVQRVGAVTHRTRCSHTLLRSVKEIRRSATTAYTMNAAAIQSIKIMAAAKHEWQ